LLEVKKQAFRVSIRTTDRRNQDGQRKYKGKIRRVRLTIVAVQKARSTSSSTTNAHSETGQMAVCCQNLTLGALSSCSALSVLVSAPFKKFDLFLNTPRITRSVCSLSHPAPCGLSVSTIFLPHYLINGAILRKEKVIEHKMCVFIVCTTLA
jgi:hypothetical protein